MRDQDLISSMAHFGARNRNKAANLCGGVLITWKHVLTAAHCNVNLEEYVAYIGTNKLNEESNGLVFYIENVETSPRYKMEILSGDLQIITLRGDSQTHLERAGIKPIDIEWFASHIPFGTRFKIMGFGGKDAIVGAPLQKRLRSGSTFSTDAKQCATKYELNTDRTETICMDGTSSTACAGDSGGPVVYFSRKSSKWTLVGVVSGGEYHKESCWEGENWHATNVEAHFEWVKQVTGKYSSKQWLHN